MGGEPAIDEVDLLRAHEYHLLALLLGRTPNAELLARLAGLEGDASPLGQAHAALAQAAAASDPAALEREFFDLFIGIGRGELIPYASYYLTGFLHERPLAGVREDMAALGIERAEHVHDPEDHLAILCEIMAGLASGRFDAGPAAGRQFFCRHLEPWAERFFRDLEQAASTPFYRSVGRVGRLFMAIEARAFAMDAEDVSTGAELRPAG
ncbi:MAG TPA: molecular chaperone TorD family protein [Geminicoccus sp.]|uniref:TorD/DmsD family molecular chaperone n=1 Tax=Geminicoccus sp. TaxID=2024832 RepID=UPI002D0CB48D|nr:molecular chaperone TorD family protein [Geminicoccus sp.]HWL70235.1 molecular chaperone TorD family protein [Geminicoccus sp.]